MTMSNENAVTEMSKKVDTIFYFVSPENLELKSEAMQRIASKFAVDLDVQMYGTRCGQSVQDPKQLLNEIKMVGVDKVEIVCIDGSSKSSTVLSYKNKNEFIRMLENGIDNSGIIAKKIVDREEAADSPVFE
jgi:hypothetical protein